MERKTKYNIGLYILVTSFEFSAIIVSSILFGLSGFMGTFIGMLAMLLYFIAADKLRKQLGIKND